MARDEDHQISSYLSIFHTLMIFDDIMFMISVHEHSSLMDVNFLSNGKLI